MASSGSTFLQTQRLVPLFEGKNYEFWFVKMRTILMSRDLWDVVDKGVTITSTADTTDDDQQLKDAMALHLIHTAVSDAIFPRIAPAHSAKEAWDRLQIEFLGTANVRAKRVQTLRREYELLKIRNGETMEDFTGKLIEIVSKMKLLGKEVKDSDVVQKILFNLPAKFDILVSVIVANRDLQELTVAELMGSLRAHEERFAMEEDRVEGGVHARQKGKSVQCYNCQNYGHMAKDCKSRSVS